MYRETREVIEIWGYNKRKLSIALVLSVSHAHADSYGRCETQVWLLKLPASKAAMIRSSEWYLAGQLGQEAGSWTAHYPISLLEVRSDDSHKRNV